MSPVVMRAHWITLVLTIASAQATVLSLPSAPPSTEGFCQQALQTTEDRLLAFQADLDVKSKVLQDLRLTFGKVFQLLNLDESQIPGGAGYTVDGLENATVIEVVTLGPTDEGGALEGGGSLSDDEDLGVNYNVDVVLELDTTTSPETSNKPSGDNEEQKPNLEGSGFSSDDEDLVINLEGSGSFGDNEGSGSFGDNEGSGFSDDEKVLKTILDGRA